MTNLVYKKGYTPTSSFAQPKVVTFISTNELDPVMPSFTDPAIRVFEALTSLLKGSSISYSVIASATDKKDSAALSASKLKSNVPGAKLSDQELALQLQQEEFEFAYGKKAANKAELVKTLQVAEDTYFAKALQAKEEQKANEYAIAKLFQEDADLALAKMLQAEEDANFALQLQQEEFEFAYEKKAANKAELVKTLQVAEDTYFAKALQAKEEQKANEYAIAKLFQEDADLALAKMLQAEEDANFALQLQQEEVANYFSSFANPIQSYNHYEVPVIGNDFTDFIVITA